MSSQSKNTAMLIACLSLSTVLINFILDWSRRYDFEADKKSFSAAISGSLEEVDQDQAAARELANSLLTRYSGR